MPDVPRNTPCPFCEIVAERAPAKRLRMDWPDAIVIEPLNPVTPGHALVIPKRHVTDATENAHVTASVMARAAEWADPPCNIITSVGAEATQTVMHLHVHVVPRKHGDRLQLPWTARPAGWLRFLPESPGRGIVAEVVGASAEGWAQPSDVPIYREVTHA